MTLFCNFLIRNRITERWRERPCHQHNNIPNCKIGFGCYSRFNTAVKYHILTVQHVHNYQAICVVVNYLPLYLTVITSDSYIIPCIIFKCLQIRTYISKLIDVQLADLQFKSSINSNMDNSKNQTTLILSNSF